MDKRAQTIDWAVRNHETTWAAVSWAYDEALAMRERRTVPAQVDRMVRPPLGLRPEWICKHHDERNRLIEIAEALTHYAEAGKPAPVDCCREIARRIESCVPRNAGLKA